MITQGKERPILFNGPMVRAILSGQKTQTRRAVNAPIAGDFCHLKWHLGYPASKDAIWAGFGNPNDPHYVRFPYGEVGDRLWVRETFMVEAHPADVGLTREHLPHTWDAAVAAAGTVYYAADPGSEILADGRRWRPSIHMPRSACRLVLEITAVRVERLQDITVQDIAAEGIACYPDINPVHDFEELWNSTGGDWNSNPWVWVIEFRRVEA